MVEVDKEKHCNIFQARDLPLFNLKELNNLETASK